MQNSSQNGAGGGIFVNGGTLTLKNDMIGTNTATTLGGGMYLAGGKATISGGTMMYNTAGLNGGGIYNSAGTLTLTNNFKVMDNNANNEGGGFYLATNSTTTFTSCTVAGNFTNGSQQTTGWGVYQQKGATVKNLAGLTDDDDPNGVPFPGS